MSRDQIARRCASSLPVSDAGRFVEELNAIAEELNESLTV